VSAPVGTAAPVSTPTIRAAVRRAGFWVVAGAGALLVAVIAFLATSASGAAGPPLAADNPAQAGSMALVEVLRQQGVTVLPVDTLDAAGAATATHPDATVFFADTEGYLAADQLAEVGTLAGRLVVADPNFATLQALAPEAGFGGLSPEDTLTASCDVAAAVQAGTISPGGKTLGLAADAPGYTGCFPGDDGTFSMVERAAAGRTVTLVADTAVFANAEIATFGNAALALNLLGADDTVVWYLPTLADVPVTGPPSLGQALRDGPERFFTGEGPVGRRRRCRRGLAELCRGAAVILGEQAGRLLAPPAGPAGQPEDEQGGHDDGDADDGADHGEPAVAPTAGEGEAGEPIEDGLGQPVEPGRLGSLIGSLGQLVAQPLLRFGRVGVHRDRQPHHAEPPRPDHAQGAPGSGRRVSSIGLALLCR
jgi:hypothetical protein